MVNVTLCFSANQALLAAKAGATFISPFVGRLDDIGQDGMELIADIIEIYDNYDFETEVLVASDPPSGCISWTRPDGADVATLPPNVLTKLANHPLTDKGLAAFLADWEKHRPVDPGRWRDSRGLRHGKVPAARPVATIRD